MPLHGLRRAVAGAKRYATIEYVGGATQRLTAASSPQSFTNLTSLTGGLATQPAAGDLIVVSVCRSDTLDCTISCSGNQQGALTEVAELYSNSTYDTNLGAYYGICGATPDTSLSISISNTSSDDSLSASVQVYRNVDATTPMDVAAQTTTGTSAYTTPPTITPSTPGAWVVVVAGAAHNNGDTWRYFTYPGMDVVSSISAQDSATDATSGVGYYDGWTSGAVSLSQWEMENTFSDSTSNSHAAVTMALRPALL